MACGRIRLPAAYYLRRQIAFSQMKDYRETAFVVKHTSLLEWLKTNWHTIGRIKSGGPQRETESLQSVNLCYDFLLAVKAKP